MRRVLFSPSWLLRHLLAAGLIVFFMYMGRWQWSKGESSHGTLQNLFYGIEWWIFTAFVLYLWAKMIIEEIRPSTPQSAGAADIGANDDAGALSTEALLRSAVPATLAVSPPDDEDPDDAELDAYNRYLAELRARDTA
ncbi:hypothetical protein I6A84_37220 [Frankia sp. CNm7]|uniref:DNA-binding transcriptional regulator of glucitol operon n=1 Tax=Frankia nepalensis TaxID=1836974 RepID=A0A937UP50_9ACTN|nr:hypothetical protein [Frankia nepalensis]MBL7502407.1 hypothetical protein [Frankia nepalensis]MBL7516158.1 hypothetical protein [Frankia nepalensis]MBL7523542.1 hypothetical protein [Frankia nepalensis]MBL7628738.1 hypothetical protein [Frankia nepalensis]